MQEEIAARAVAGDWKVATQREAIVSASGITKRFPGVLAVDNVDFAIAPGEIVALVGQNGAGKSTLIQILSGAYPYGTFEGEVTLSGSPYRAASIAEAEHAGIAIVPQEISIAPELTIAENMYLNAEPTWCGLIDRSLQLFLARETLEAFKLRLDPTRQMRSLDLPTQQLVVIARALSKSTQLLILDEPTAALTESESLRLFGHLRTLAASGVAIIFVSHRLGEVFAISDRIVVMRDGRIRGSFTTSRVSREAIVSEMVGDVPLREETPSATYGAVAMSVDALTVYGVDDDQKRHVDVISFDISKGEILGLFGLLGAGCTETALALYGAWPGRVDGEVRIDGSAARLTSPNAAVGYGLGFIGQDRRDCLLLDHSVSDNALLSAYEKISSCGLLDVATGQRLANSLVSRLSIKAPSIESIVGTLSGGNQQKTQIARWLAADARILVLIDPTRGVDVGARIEIKRVWRELAAAGYALLVASTDTEELVDICDRILVMQKAKIVGELTGAQLSEAELLRVATDV